MVLAPPSRILLFSTNEAPPSANAAKGELKKMPRPRHAARLERLWTRSPLSVRASKGVLLILGFALVKCGEGKKEATEPRHNPRRTKRIVK